jgi:DMSO/TMAO reductase YedYZ molybdopterin-dependent catalytic subunit
VTPARAARGVPARRAGWRGWLLPGPPPAPPFRDGAFTSSLHDERVAAVLGVALGVTFTLCFATGLLSHWAQLAQPAVGWPVRPRDLYRWTQGIHVVSGVVSVPLLLAKLFAVYPRLWTWPPLRGAAHAVERAMLVPLVGGALLLLVSGLQNVFYWYPTPFAFTVTHYWTAWVTVGALVVHVGAKLAVAGAALRRPEPAADPGAAGRRQFLATVAVAAGVAGAGFLAQAVSPLRALALLAPRRSDAGPQRLPVNKSASGAGVVELASSPGYRLEVTGAVARPLRLSLVELRARATREADLPIACVEGWSVGARWRGVPVRALLAEAGARRFSSVLVASVQPHGPYRGSRLTPAQALHPDTLLAVELNGEPLDLDHGFPVRLVAPNRPGVSQTKWVASVRVE